MGQKKDIGTLFEKKLNDGKKTPNISVWDKINISLDEEKRRKRRVIFYWLMGGGISVLLGSVILFENVFFQNKESFSQEGNTNVVEDLNTNSTKERGETLFKISKEDSLITRKNDEETFSRIDAQDSEETLSKINTSTKNLKQSEVVNSPETNSETKMKKTSSNKNPIEETFTVSEKYYYYNSRDGKQLITESKKEIDSLISKQYKSLDTITSKKNDSLEQ